MTLLVAKAGQASAIIDSLKPGISSIFIYRLVQSYLPNNPELDLLVVARADDGGGDGLSLLVAEATEGAENLLPEQLLSEKYLSGEELCELGALLKVPIVNLCQPLQLEPVAIPKPWGQEIWYTGIEQRGLSRVTDGQHSVPLAWLIAVAPYHLMAGVGQMPNLLKILDPLPEPVYGDLYFELHEQKREVYVVTHIDRQAWHDGIGQIRYGFSAAIRDGFDRDDEFRIAYRKAVTSYRAVRRQMDALIDCFREEACVPLNEPVSAEWAKRWQQRLPADLLEQEHRLREEMNRFTHLKALRVGDVIKVPLLMPHALQHGVRTIEFQTPVYERKILSFDQKVLTQAEWDTDEAIELMSVYAPQEVELAIIDDNGPVKRELVADFADFEVQRVTLQPGAQWQLNKTLEHAVVIVVSGELGFGDVVLVNEQAAFIPAQRDDISVCNLAVGPSVLLVSQPHLHSCGC